MKKIAILGSTGSIGTQTIDVLSHLQDRFEISAITANTDYAALLKQAKELNIKSIGLCGLYSLPPDVSAAGIKCSFGKDALISACEAADEVVLGVTGISGLPAFEYCLKHNKKVYLATKEALVCGGQLTRKLMDSTKTEVIPLDSEISAIYQCFLGNNRKDMSRILLTCSGGPFLNSTKEELYKVSPAQALKHPTWSMGSKISIDSASLMNKGLEVMETRWFFDVDPKNIEVVIHPESIIHSMVEYNDSSIIAQLSTRDMRVPIHYAFSAPGRRESVFEKLDLFKIGSLNFIKPDLERFPCLALSYEAAKDDGSLQIIINAANEAAVPMFLNNKIGFMDIPKLLEEAMNSFSSAKAKSFEDIYEIDKEVRIYAAKFFS